MNRYPPIMLAIYALCFLMGCIPFGVVLPMEDV